jgi:Ferritin-like
MIDTREELLDALSEAAELEHGLLLQYLFAAYSLKKRRDEGLGAQQQEDVRRWEGAILLVARQEMAHLGSVCNLLSAVGGSPRMGRPNFPQPGQRYYPFDFRLQRFGDAALYRFLCFELPKGEPPPPPPATGMSLLAEAAVVPDPLEFDRIGELYRQIRHGFQVVPERQLFIGPRFAQDTDQWSNRFVLHLVTNRATAERAIDAIVLEGEGAPDRLQPSHYDTFLGIRKQLAAAGAAFRPARPVVSDPRTRVHRDAPEGGTLLTNRQTVAMAELSNGIYLTVLLLLLQYYSFLGESPAQRAAVRLALRNLMSGAVRPVAELLTELPATEDPAAGTAGPPFELYADVRISTQADSRWILVLEHLQALAARAHELAPDSPRLTVIGENLGWIAANLQAARRAG